jgi:hypothetical protein
LVNDSFDSPIDAAAVELLLKEQEKISLEKKKIVEVEV